MKIKKLIYLFIYKMCSFEKRAKLLKLQGVKIGNNCEIYSNTSFGSEPYLIEIGNNVRISAGVKLTTHDGGLWVLRNLNDELSNSDKFGRIKIGNNVHIGIDSIIMPKVTIGDNVIIGAGSVVTKNIPSNSVAVGVPAKIIESVDEYYEKNKDKIVFTRNLNSMEKRKFIEENIK